MSHSLMYKSDDTYSSSSRGLWVRYVGVNYTFIRQISDRGAFQTLWYSSPSQKPQAANHSLSKANSIFLASVEEQHPPLFYPCLPRFQCLSLCRCRLIFEAVANDAFVGQHFQCRWRNYSFPPPKPRAHRFIDMIHDSGVVRG